jgi:hypothetical protein
VVVVCYTTPCNASEFPWRIPFCPCQVASVHRLRGQPGRPRTREGEG